MKVPERVQNATAYIILVEVYELVTKHKKTAFIVFVFELWVHSLTFSHMAELKSVIQLIPFFGN